MIYVILMRKVSRKNYYFSRSFIFKLMFFTLCSIVTYQSPSFQLRATAIENVDLVGLYRE